MNSFKENKTVMLYRFVFIDKAFDSFVS